MDIANGYFYSGATIAELAGKMVNKHYESYKMPAAALEDTVTRYNSFVDTGVDKDFKRVKPAYKIQTPPFYAAWLPNAPHDTLTGLWVNGKFQVRDIFGEPIPSLFCVGESASGQSMHGHGKNISSGYAVGLFATRAESLVGVRTVAGERVQSQGGRVDPGPHLTVGPVCEQVNNHHLVRSR